MDKGSLTSKNDFIDVQSKSVSPSGPCRPRGSWTGELDKAAGVCGWHWVSSPCWKELVVTAVHTGRQNSEHQRQRGLWWRLVSELRAMPQKLRITSLGLAELIKSLDFWGQLTCQEPESLGGNLRLYIFSKDSRWFGCPWGFWNVLN